MKILFAVNNESISEAIIKRYQQDYKEIISSKNVYYFDAITKELQKDKSYDRVIISEDVEPFANNNYSVIDKFIFDRLDSISDEATSNNGQDIPIILICTDRRSKSENFLVKIFGIGVYSALIGQDRTVSNVCQLINKPRSKKEAKIYYKIDTDDVEYKAEHEEDVSEEEIRNILNHYKRLGKNEAEYVRSFDNIATQYTDAQLKIICRFLPLNVKAVLEASSPKYQELVTFSEPTNSKNDNNVKHSKFKFGREKVAKKEESKKLEIVEKNIGRSELTKPVIIPSAIGSTKSANIQSETVDNVQRKSIQTQQNENYINPPIIQNEPVTTNVNGLFATEEVTENKDLGKDEINDILNSVENEIKQEHNVQEAAIQTNSEEPKKRRGRPRKIKPENEVIEEKPKKKRGRPRKVQEEPDDNENREEIIENNDDGSVDLFNLGNSQETSSNNGGIILPGLEDNSTTEKPKSNSDLFDFENTSDSDTDDSPNLFNISEDEQNESPSLFDLGEDDNQKQSSDLFGKRENQRQSSNLFDDEEEPRQSSSLFDDREDSRQSSSLFDDREVSRQSSSLFEQREDSRQSSNLFDESNGKTNRDNDENDLTSLFGTNNETNQNTEYNRQNGNQYNNTREVERINNYQHSDVKNLLSMSNKLVAFVGTSKNGTSFLVNNIADILSRKGIKTAILDLTKNKNAYYIYTQNDENLRKTAYNCIQNLKSGVTKGIEVNKNLTVYTNLPEKNTEFDDYKNILTTLLENYSLVLMDCDFDTRYEYFDLAQEIYLVQSYDILTIQPLTAFLRNLKSKNMLDPQKLRVVLNKVLRVRSITDKIIIGGMSSYNDPSMSYMTELFDRENIKYCSIPFEQETYSKYLDGLVNCEISTKGYSKNFMSSLEKLANMIYPLLNNDKPSNKLNNYSNNKFSNNMNSTLNKMKNSY